MLRSITIHVLAIAIVTSGALAGTWNIFPDGSGDAPTIQAGIDSASTGDAVVLADGTFSGDGNRDIDFLGKAITVRSQSGDPHLCIIDCEGTASESHRGFAFHSGEGADAVLEGLTVENGYWLEGGKQGGGIYCTAGSSPTIRDLRLVGNVAADEGGGLYCDGGSSPVVLRVEFRSNRAYNGGGLYWFGGVSNVSECLFVSNHASVSGGGGDWRYLESGMLDHLVFSENRSAGTGGGALLYRGAAIQLSNSTFVGNRAVWGSGVFRDGSRVVTLSNVIIAYGLESEGLLDPWEHIQLSCCDIFGNEGGDWVGSIADQLGIDGNFSACPSFCSLETGDYHLCDQSPCAPGNHPAGDDCGLIGALDVGCACGPSKTESSSWGGIKGLYR